MKLHHSINTKHTTRLFNNKYKYKAVVITKKASLFRGKNFDCLKEKVDLDPKLSDDEKVFIFKIYNFFKKIDDFTLRIENPLISFYTNSPDDIEKLTKLDVSRIKYVSYPKPGSESLLDSKKIIVKTLDFEFKVTIGPTRQNYSNFIAWCDNQNHRIKMPKRARSQLAKDRSWGGYYIYVKDEKLLTMVKMFLGGNIQAVESLIKA